MTSRHVKVFIEVQGGQHPKERSSKFTRPQWVNLGESCSCCNGLVLQRFSFILNGQACGPGFKDAELRKYRGHIRVRVSSDVSVSISSDLCSSVWKPPDFFATRGPMLPRTESLFGPRKNFINFREFSYACEKARWFAAPCHCLA